MDDRRVGLTLAQAKVRKATVNCIASDGGAGDQEWRTCDGQGGDGNLPGE